MFLSLCPPKGGGAKQSETKLGSLNQVSQIVTQPAQRVSTRKAITKGIMKTMTLTFLALLLLQMNARQPKKKEVKEEMIRVKDLRNSFLPEHRRSHHRRDTHGRNRKHSRFSTNTQNSACSKSLDQHPTISLKQLSNHYQSINN